MTIRRRHVRTNKTEKQYTDERQRLKSCIDCIMYDDCVRKFGGPPLLMGISSCDKFQLNGARVMVNYLTMSIGT